MVQAESGLMSLNGFPDGEPHKTAIAMIDITIGMFAAHAILAALYARVPRATGVKQSMFRHANVIIDFLTLSDRLAMIKTRWADRIYCAMA